MPDASQQTVSQRKDECEGEDIPYRGDLISDAQPDGPGLCIEGSPNGREDQPITNEHRRQEYQADRPPKADLIYPKQKMEGCSQDRIIKQLQDSRNKVPPAGGIAFDVEGQVFLQNQDDQDQRK